MPRPAGWRAQGAGAVRVTQPKGHDPEVPLFLIANAVAEGIRRRGGKLYRISVVRTHSHRYRIRYKCRVKAACTGKARAVLRHRHRDRDQKTLSAFRAQDPAECLEIPANRDGVRGDGQSGA